MMRIAINGYGNLGRGVERAVALNPDMDAVAVFTRRNPDAVQTAGTPVVSVSDMSRWADKVDVCINCGGSATDLSEQSPAATRFFNTVDSFDTHRRIPEHFETLDAVARESGHTVILSAGWDPGLFSMIRVLAQAVLPDGRDATFWGRGISQGHSDAIRHIEGVADARQYTVPIETTMAAVRAGEPCEMTPRNMHRRECYVVLEPGADNAESRERIERDICEMPNYFAEYDTTVEFIAADELERKHSHLSHAGRVIRAGQTAPGVKHRVELELELDSNPEFTGSVLAACARACGRKHDRGEIGAFTMLDLTVADLSAKTPQELREHFL